MKFHYLLIFLVVFASCDTVLDVDIPREASKLVINAVINPDSLMNVHISQSRYILDHSYKFPFEAVNNAHVEIFEEGVFKEQLTKTQEDGMYVSQLKPQEGRSYTLTAEAANYTPIEATVYLNPKVPIQDIALDSTVREFHPCPSGENCPHYVVLYKVDLKFKDPPNTANYYSVLAYGKRQYVVGINNPDGDSIRKRTEPLLIHSESLSSELTDYDPEEEGWINELYFSDEVFDGQTYTFSFDIEDGSFESDKIVEILFVLKHLTEAQYKYVVSREIQDQNADNPFAEPGQVYNNIENGYGIFAGYSADTKVVKP